MKSQTKQTYFTLNGRPTAYVLVNLHTKQALYVSQKVFEKMDYPVVQRRDVKVRYYNGDRKEAQRIARAMPQFQAQSLVDDCHKAVVDMIAEMANILRGGKLLIKACAVVGGGEPEQVDKFGPVLRSVFDFLLESTVAYYSGSMLSLMSCLFRLALVVFNIRDFLIPESLDGILFAMASLMLPAKVIEAFRRLSMFTNVKLLDDIGGFHQFVAAVDEYILSLISFVFPGTSREEMEKHMWGRHHLILSQIRNIALEAEQDPKKFMQPAFRERVKKLADSTSKNAALADWERTNGAVAKLTKKMAWLNKVALNYENTSRIEPICFAFEGPPGCGKSKTLNQLLKYLKVSVYSHLTKAVGDGKDFWDAYNNEEVMVCDDWGQLGVSQFRMLINLVAPVKLPLDCAEASLKDTKFFNSRAILFTTNRFSTIHSLSKNDMITDITALWRRVSVFEWSGDVVTIKSFNPAVGVWKPGPQPGIPSLLPFQMKTSNKSELLAWMAGWYHICTVAKETQDKENSDEVDDEEIDTFLRTWNLMPEDREPSQEEVSFGEVMDEVMPRWIRGEVSEPAEDSMLSKIMSLRVPTPAAIATIVGTWAMFMVWRFSKTREKRFFAEHSLMVRREENMNASTAAMAVKKQVRYIRMANHQESVAIGWITGHYVITIGHGVKEDDGWLTVYNGIPEDDLRMLDHVPYTLVYRNEQADIAILRYSENVVTVFKDQKNFLLAQLRNKGVEFIHPVAVVKLDGKIESRQAGVYAIKGKDLHVPDGLIYREIQGEGFCGSLIFSEDEGIVGMHVAGDPQTKKGFAQMWSRFTKEEILRVLQSDKLLSQYDFKETPLASGIKVDKNFHSSNPTKTKIIPSPLHGVFPVEKEPVNPGVNGPHTVKDSLKEALGRVSDVDPVELEEAEKLLDMVVPTYSPITMREVIKGNDVLASMKKETATGIGLEAREVYVDFEAGILTEKGEALYGDFLRKVESGNLDVEDIVAKEAVKDELRSVRKKRFPRTFRVTRLPVNILLKKCMGDLAAKITKQKWFNGIMLAFNPYTEMDIIYDMLTGREPLDLDIRFWDKSMVIQVMHVVARVLCRKFQGTVEERENLRVVLDNAIQGYVSANDDTYWMTHSFASGLWITTLFNSLVQLSYLRMWHYRVTQRSVVHFYSDVRPFILGDDLICGVRKDSQLDAFNMRDFYTSIGLGATSSTKGDITEKYGTFDTATFLKRRFRFHPQLKRMVGVLLDETLLSSISWVDSTKDVDGVVLDKIVVFQIEAYLHEKRGELLEILERRCVQESIPFRRLPDEYLYGLFLRREVPYESFDGVFL